MKITGAQGVPNSSRTVSRGAVADSFSSPAVSLAVGDRGRRGAVHQAEYKIDQCDLPTHQTEQQATSCTSAIRSR